MSADDLMMATWRDDGERVRLVEEVIHLKKRLHLAETAMRERVQAEERFLAGQPTITALMARVRELEHVIERQNEILRRAS